MTELSDRIIALAPIGEAPLARKLVPILTQPTGTSSAGRSFFHQRAWEDFRDTIPHLFLFGLETLRGVDRIEAAVAGMDAPADELESVRAACAIARQIVFTAAITAPPNLWLLRHVLSFFAELGLLERLLDGEALCPDGCVVSHGGEARRLVSEELEADLSFLLSLGIVEQYDESYRIAGHRRVRRMLEGVPGLPPRPPIDPTPLFRRLFAGEALRDDEQELVLELALSVPKRLELAQNHWVPTLEEMEVGYRLVPIVLGLRAAERTDELTAGIELRGASLSREHPLCAAGALEVLTAAGWVERIGERYRVTVLGACGFARGPGPFGIIQTYHPYMTMGREILLHGRGDVWVTRSENVGASQDANRRTFERANDQLDRFCADTGFSYRVFIEHAVGRGGPPASASRAAARTRSATSARTPTARGRDRSIPTPRRAAPTRRSA